MTKSDFLKIECCYCAGHIEYPAEVGGQSITCPHCGQPVELPRAVAPVAKSRRSLVFGILALGIVVMAIGSAFLLQKRSSPVPTPENVPAATPVPVAKPAEETTTNGFAVSAFKLEKTPGSSLVYVTGTVRNLTDKQRFGVKAEFGLFDTNGVSTGAASDYAATLAPHDVWKFKALVMGSKTAQAKLNSVREDQ